MSSPPTLPERKSLLLVPLRMSGPLVPILVTANATPLATNRVRAVVATNSMMRLIFAPFSRFAITATVASVRLPNVTKSVTKKVLAVFRNWSRKTASPRSYRPGTPHLSSKTPRDIERKSGSRGGRTAPHPKALRLLSRLPRPPDVSTIGVHYPLTLCSGKLISLTQPSEELVGHALVVVYPVNELLVVHFVRVSGTDEVSGDPYVALYLAALHQVLDGPSYVRPLRPCSFRTASALWRTRVESLWSPITRR